MIFFRWYYENSIFFFFFIFLSSPFAICSLRQSCACHMGRPQTPKRTPSSDEYNWPGKMAYWIFIWIIPICRWMASERIDEGVPPYGETVKRNRGCSRSLKMMHYGFMHMTHAACVCVCVCGFEWILQTEHIWKFSQQSRCSSHVNRAHTHALRYDKRPLIIIFISGKMASGIISHWFCLVFFFLMNSETFFFGGRIYITWTEIVFPLLSFLFSVQTFSLLFSHRPITQNLTISTSNQSKIGQSAHHTVYSPKQNMELTRLPWNQFTILSSKTKKKSNSHRAQ